MSSYALDSLVVTIQREGMVDPAESDESCLKFS